VSRFQNQLAPLHSGSLLSSFSSSSPPSCCSPRSPSPAPNPVKEWISASLQDRRPLTTERRSVSLPKRSASPSCVDPGDPGSRASSLPRLSLHASPGFPTHRILLAAFTFCMLVAARAQAPYVYPDSPASVPEAPSERATATAAEAPYVYPDSAAAAPDTPSERATAAEALAEIRAVVANFTVWAAAEVGPGTPRYCQVRE